MTAPAPAELEQDCSDELGHWMCSACSGPPVFGRMYRTFCGVVKRYQGGRWELPHCAVCNELRKRPCESCGR